MAATSDNKSKGLPTQVVELKDLVVAYAKQETLEPIKGLGKFLAMGVAGSVMLSIGLVLLVLALLRALQTETGDALDGSWSFVPYVITLVVCGVVAALAARSIGAAKRRRERSKA